MPNKPITQGYRILALCWKCYTWNWLYSSHAAGIQIPEWQLYCGPIHLTPTSIAVYQLVKALPYCVHQFNIYMDNYFSNIALFQVLRTLGIGACSTTRQNKNVFPPKIHNSFSGLPWNHLCGAQQGSFSNPVLALQWEDSGSVHLLSTIHKIDQFVNHERKKPRTTSTNAATTRRPFTFGRQRAILPMPQIIDDYNHHQKGVDCADQLRASYSTQLKALCN